MDIKKITLSLWCLYMWKNMDFFSIFIMSLQGKIFTSKLLREAMCTKHMAWILNQSLPQRFHSTCTEPRR